MMSHERQRLASTPVVVAKDNLKTKKTERNERLTCARQKKKKKKLILNSNIYYICIYIIINNMTLELNASLCKNED